MAPVCSSAAIGSNLSLFGAEVLSVSADIVTGYSRVVPPVASTHNPTITVNDATFCNVTVTYTHPGEDDNVNVNIWLPGAGDWNNRLLSVGGAGYAAGGYPLTDLEMAAAIGQGFVGSTTDAGLGQSFLPQDWALVSPGNVNRYLLQNLLWVSLGDQASITKSVIKNYYGAPPEYSYWSGCSQGGRQGMQLAQRYPDAYDGIVASAPVINFPELVVSTFWPQAVMNDTGEYPHLCELVHLSQLAIEACDGLDGVKDGVISNMEKCHFDPESHVGESFRCLEGETNTTIDVSHAAAVVVKAVWSGAKDSKNRQLMPGIGIGADLMSPEESTRIAGTDCSDGKCKGVPTPLGSQWIQYFVEKNAAFDVSAVNRKEFERIFYKSAAEYNSSLTATNNPDLSAFRDAGGKLLTFHGMADQVVPYKNTERYIDAVSGRLSDREDFYRHFRVPGLGHCAGGNNALPTTALKQLQDWVEKGVQPQTVPIEFQDASGKSFRRNLCPYPKNVVFNGGDPTVPESFSCRSRC